MQDQIYRESLRDPLPSRTCGNCACHMVQGNVANPMETQSFCRRNTPMAQQVRIEQPRIRDGKPVMGRDGKPIMENGIAMAYLYAPTQPALTCFDGWRPIDSLPGEKILNELPDLMTVVNEGMKKLLADLQKDREDSALDSVQVM